MKKIIDIFYFIIFIMMVAIPLLSINTKKNVSSDFDNRVLVELPEMFSSDFEAGIESYLQDRIGFRDQMVTCYQLLNDRVTGELTHPIYTYGKEKYSFFKMHSNVNFDSYHEIFADSVIKMKDYCEARGIHFYFMFDPEKLSVYRRYLPEGVNYDDEWVDELITYLTNQGVKVVNNRDLLIEKSYDEQVFNKQYDAGHWNDLGCFYGTNNLWETINMDFPAVNKYSLDEFEIGSDVGDYLGASRFPVNEEVPVFYAKYDWDDITNTYSDLQIDPEFGYFQYYINKEKNAVEYPKMLIFHGSYYNRAPRFLVGRSREYIGVHDYQNVLNLDYYINVFQPELVVFEVAEYTIDNTYFDRKKMKKLKYAPYLLEAGLSVEELLSNADEETFPITFSIQHKEGVDNIQITCEDIKPDYLYLAISDNIYDLQKDEDIYWADIGKEILDQTVEDIRLVWKDSDEGVHWIKVNYPDS